MKKFHFNARKNTDTTNTTPLTESKLLRINTQNGTIVAENVSVRPTFLCVLLLCLSVAIWLAAVNYQVNIAYALCFWLIGWVGMAWVFTRRQLVGTNVALALQEEVFAGETAKVQLRFYHTHVKRARLFWWRSASLSHHEKNTTAAWQRVNLAENSDDVFETIWQFPVQQRGLLPSDWILEVVTSAPFGLFQAVCGVQWQSAAVVYPAPLAHQDFGQQAQSGDDTPAPPTRHQHSDDLSHLKHHQRGGSLQNIAWKVYAKRGELMDKVFDEPHTTVHRETISHLDYPPNLPADKLASLLTYRVLQAEKLGIAYTLVLPQLTLTPQNGLREKSLHALAMM